MYQIPPTRKHYAVPDGRNSYAWKSRDLRREHSDACRALLIRAKHGDRDAREQLIAGNLRLVLSVIQKFTGRGESADDLFQVGCIGLLKAIANFDIRAYA